MLNYFSEKKKKIVTKQINLYYFSFYHMLGDLIETILGLSFFWLL